MAARSVQYHRDYVKNWGALRFSLRSLFLLITAACVLFFLISLFWPRPEDREVAGVEFLVYPFGNHGPTRHFNKRTSDGTSYSFLDYEPFGIVDELLIVKTPRNQHWYWNPSRYKRVRPSDAITPEMISLFDETIALIVSKSNGKSVDEIFAEQERRGGTSVIRGTGPNARIEWERWSSDARRKE